MALRKLRRRSQFREADTVDEHVSPKFGSSGRLNPRFVPIIRRTRARQKRLASLGGSLATLPY